MPDVEDVKEGLDSSDSPETLDATPSSNEPEGQGAASSDAQGDSASDLLSVVRDVVDARGEPEAKASPAEGAKEGDEPDDGAPKKEQDDENYSDVPFHKHPRFQQLLRQKNGFKEDAARYQNVQSFLDSHGLSGQEAADGLVIMALAKTNPAEAWKHLKPFVERVLQAAGEMLPEDLAQRVRNGELTDAAAFEISRARAQASSVETQRRFDQQQQERQIAVEKARALYDAANSWEHDRQAKDPNFGAKAEPLRKEIAYLQLTEGKPDTPRGVLDQLNRAYKAVNDSYVPPRPRATERRAISPVTGGQIAGRTRAEPKNTMDVINQVIDARSA